MTPQEIFDTVWHAMKAQGEQSYKRGEGCMYRHPEGYKCAAGCLIGDDEYSGAMEGAVFGIAEHPTTDAILYWPDRLMDHKRLVIALQECHDAQSGCFWENFSAGAVRVAAKYNLTIPESNQ